jgi:hypothetical protein
MRKVNLGLITRKTIWWPTWRGWICLLFLIVGLGGCLMLNLHSWLAITKTVPANILVVEGWIPDQAVKSGLLEFTRNPYTHLIATGGPISRGEFLSDHGTYAQLAAATLLSLGLRTNQLLVAPGSMTYRSRTRHSALAARESLRTNGVVLQGINVISEGTHARRSWLVYRRIFGSQVPVGIISFPPQDYDPQRWWVTSAGAKSVITEAIGWLYEWLFGDRHG